MNNALKAKIKRLELGIAEAELRSAAKQSDARRQIIAIAKDLLPVAAGLARRGKPRLLAVCAKIIGTDELKPNLESLKKLAR